MLLSDDLYNQLRSDQRMSHLQYLIISGSHAYGTAVDGSDIDIRGWVMPPKLDILGLTHTKIMDSLTYPDHDVVLYTFHKFIHLLAQCNPNVVEQMGVDDDMILYASPYAKALRTIVDKFLSKRAFVTFGGYANSQLQQIEHALHNGGDGLVHRNRKSAGYKLHKHLSHLIRLYYMGIDILQNHIVQTHRVKEHDLLMSIRNGEVSLDYVFDLRNDLEKKLQQAYEESTLPDEVDRNKINQFVATVTEQYIRCPVRFATDWEKIRR